MAKIVWDADTDRMYTYGVDQGVLYRQDGFGVPWSGLISVTEKGDAEQQPKYFEGRRYYNKPSRTTFEGTIAAYTYPDEFELCIGLIGMSTAQTRNSFSFSYRTSNELHIVYNALAAPSQRAYNTLTEQVNPVEMEWDFTTQPVKIPGGRPTSHVVILLDSAPAAGVSELEDLLYGTDGDDILDTDGNVIGNTGLDPSLPAITDIVEIFESTATMRIIDNDDGTWTAIGPDNMVTVVDSETFQITASSVYLTSADTFTVSSV